MSGDGSRGVPTVSVDDETPSVGTGTTRNGPAPSQPRRNQPRPMSEADFLRRVIDLAILAGWRVSHSLPSQNGKGRWRTATQGHIGVPDLVLARRGVVILAELKSATGRTTLDQECWLNALGAHGRLWTPKDWDAIVAELSGSPARGAA